MTDITKLVNRSAPRTGVGSIQRGRIVRAPIDENDTLEVVIPRYSAGLIYDVPAENWSPRGPDVPTPGMSCLVIIDDLGDAHVPMYMGENSFDTSFAFFSA